MAVRSHFCAQWESFRNHLTNRQRDNLSALLNAELLVGNLRHGRQRIIIVTHAPKVAVFVYLWKDVLYLLGAHWLREGQPTADFLKMVRRDLERIQNGRLK